MRYGHNKESGGKMENAALGLKYGYGDGHGYGYGYGDGDGDGDGHGDGDGYGYGYGHGYGYGYGHGYGHGYGDGDGYGHGYGDGCKKIKIGAKKAWIAYHYILKSSSGVYVLRSNQPVKIGEELRERRIRMCEYGLHASLSAADARIYAPNDSVLTKVKVWGTLICQRDKLVATRRQIIEEVRA